MSLTIRGLVIYLIALLLDFVGLSYEHQDLEAFITVFLQLIAAVMIYWGRYRKGDISIFGTKKV